MTKTVSTELQKHQKDWIVALPLSSDSLQSAASAKECTPAKKVDRRGTFKWFKAQVEDQVAVGCSKDCSLCYKLPEKYPPISEHDDDAVQLEGTISNLTSPLVLTGDTVEVPTESLLPQMPDASVTADVSRPGTQPVPVTNRSGKIVQARFNPVIQFSQIKFVQLLSKTKRCNALKLSQARPQQGLVVNVMLLWSKIELHSIN